MSVPAAIFRVHALPGEVWLCIRVGDEVAPFVLSPGRAREIAAELVEAAKAKPLCQTVEAIVATAGGGE